MIEPILSSSETSFMLRRIASKPSLCQAWRKVRANRGAAGVDAVSLQLFERDLDANLTELGRNLLDRTYEPLPARYVSVSKPNGKERELAIPAVRDRVAQLAVLDCIEPLFESQFLDCSFAFRSGRSVEMAIQRVVVARAQGRLWTVDADICEFFPSIDHAILTEELSRTVNDQDLLNLVGLWLDAGALDGTRPKARWVARWREVMASAQLAVGDAVNNMLEQFLSERLGLPSSDAYADFEEGANLDGEGSIEEADAQPSGSRLGRAAMRRLLQDGVLVALAQRAALKGLISAKALGLGGAALAAAMLAPPVVWRLKSMTSHKTGAAQGSPISPLFSNVYLHGFDRDMIERGSRLVRYCDDFLILCQSETEAREAISAAREALGERRLRLSVEKTRLVAPGEPFDFLGYHFATDGRVVPPASIPEVVARRVIEFADRSYSQASRQASLLASSTGKKAGSMFERVKAGIKNRKQK